MRLAPLSVLAFLETVRYDDYGKTDRGSYGHWRPIAEKVSQSQTLILRALALFMLEDHNGFAEAAYSLADRDADAIPLAAMAALDDPDPVRSIKRMLQYHDSQRYKTLGTKPEKACQANTAKALDGDQLDEAIKQQLRAQPWVRQLSTEHQQALGLVP